MLAKCFRKLWLMKAGLRSLEICKTPMKKSNVMFIYLITNMIIWTIVVRMSMPLSLHGNLKTHHILVPLSSRFIEIRKMR
jgi:hypothetical protein